MLKRRSACSRFNRGTCRVHLCPAASQLIPSPENSSGGQVWGNLILLSVEGAREVKAPNLGSTSLQMEMNAS